MRSARSDADQEQSSAVLVISEKLPSYTCATFWRCRILENEWNPNISSTEPRKDNFPWRWNGLLRLKEELSHVVTGWKRLLQCTRFFTRQINGLPLAAFINPKLQWSTSGESARSMSSYLLKSKSLSHSDHIPSFYVPQRNTDKSSTTVNTWPWSLFTADFLL